MGWILRASVTVLWLMLVAKLMGQREIGCMNMFDFVVAITIGSVASSHLADSEVPMMKRWYQWLPSEHWTSSLRT